MGDEMEGRNSAAPIVIKRKKVVEEGGHHGGAWKVAYADFVTAMMAFFMLMWLLNATTEKQRKGLADYFSPAIPINRISGGGDGALSGNSVAASKDLSHNGVGGAQSHAGADRSDQAARGRASASFETKPQETGKLRQLEAQLNALGGETMTHDNLMRHVVTRVTDRGLIVEIFDLPGAPLFADDTARPSELTHALVTMIAGVFALVRNKVAIEGHVRSYPVVLADNPVWPLSTGRAEAIRKLMEAGRLPPGRLKEVGGFADRVPAVSDPTAVRNNRIDLILLRDLK